MSRRKHDHKSAEVEINLTAMLDMAFQLLAFFVLTFKPAPMEGQISLRMPPSRPAVTIKTEDKTPGSVRKQVDEGLDTLVVGAFPNETGALGSMQVFEDPVATLPGLDRKLREALASQSAFEQVLIQVHSGLRYDALMSVVDVCTRQKMNDGKPLTKLSFVELDPGAK